jgi:hypothetical protein
MFSRYDGAMDDDPLSLRLGDLKRSQTIRVRCGCGRLTEFPHGHLQRRYRIPSNVLVFDLQFRLRCSGCRSRGPFRISIINERDRGSATPMPERVIVGASGAKVLRLVKR